MFIQDEQLWFKQLWSDRGNLNGNKLRCYRLFKKDLRPDPYVLCFIPRGHRSVLAKLRNGSLPLHVETGRYTRPVTPLYERLCCFCNSKVENEIHFLCECDMYIDLRYPLFRLASQFYLQFDFLSSREKFIQLMNSEALQAYIAKFIYLAMRRRRNLMSEFTNGDNN